VYRGERREVRGERYADKTIIVIKKRREMYSLSSPLSPLRMLRDVG